MLDYAESGAHALVAFWGFFGAAATPELLHDMQLLLTAIYTSLIVWIVGLAVPVTASYIICAVIAAPAMIKLGVPDFAAHMFIFYYAVLSEVSPPTALSPFAAAAITGGGPYRTTLQAWKYCAPAFLLPFMFVLDASGVALLLTGSFKNLAAANWGSIVLVALTAALGHRRARGRPSGMAPAQDDTHRALGADRRRRHARLSGAALRLHRLRARRRGRDPAENAQSRGGRRCGLRHAGTPSRELKTPFAVLGIRTVGERVTDIEYLPVGAAVLAPLNALAEQTCVEIERYLDDPAYPMNVPFELEGTLFQRRVWSAISDDPARPHTDVHRSRAHIANGAAAGRRRVRGESPAARDSLPSGGGREWHSVDS